MHVLKKAIIIAIKRLYATTMTVHFFAFVILGTQEMALIVKVIVQVISGDEKFNSLENLKKIFYDGCGI